MTTFIYRFLALSVLAGSALAGGRDVYVINNSIVSSTYLGRVDLTTGVFTQIGPLPCNCGYGIAFGPDGRLFASDQTRLVTLDPDTAALDSVVGPYGLSGVGISGLAFHPTTAVLYAIDSSHGTLVTLDTSTGSLTTIGSLNVQCCGMSGLAWSRDGSTLFAIHFDNGCLYTLDPATGNATSVGCWVCEEPLDLATNPTTGELYTPEWKDFAANVLALVCPTNGVRAGVMSVPGTDQIEGIAFSPESMGTRRCVSTPNSTGAAARILPWGSTSSSAGNLRFSAGPVPDRPGLFFHGPATGQLPFGNGALCVFGDLVRGSVLIPTGGRATYVYDESDARHSLAAYVLSTRHFQYWFRDPAAGGANFNTSDAFSVLITQ